MKKCTKQVKIRSYLFITTEGYTYQPNSESIEPDVENCQVIASAEGGTIDDRRCF